MRRLLPAIALCACLLAGCGSDDDQGRTVTADPGEPVRVVAKEYSFDPSTVVARAGAVEIELENEGSLAHNLKVFDGKQEIGGTSTFPAGRTAGTTLELPAGEYRMICTVGDHEELGMSGTLLAR